MFSVTLCPSHLQLFLSLRDPYCVLIPVSESHQGQFSRTIQVPTYRFFYQYQDNGCNTRISYSFLILNHLLASANLSYHYYQFTQRR